MNIQNLLSLTYLIQKINLGCLEVFSISRPNHSVCSPRSIRLRINLPWGHRGWLQLLASSLKARTSFRAIETSINWPLRGLHLKSLQETQNEWWRRSIPRFRRSIMKCKNLFSRRTTTWSSPLDLFRISSCKRTRSISADSEWRERRVRSKCFIREMVDSKLERWKKSLTFILSSVSTTRSQITRVTPLRSKAISRSSRPSTIFLRTSLCISPLCPTHRWTSNYSLVSPKNLLF